MFDGGTGLRSFGENAARQGPVKTDILFSHVHWDHIQGVPFFSPLFDPATSLTLHGAPDSASLEEILHGQMSGPCFPVRLDAVAARIDFRPIPVGERFTIGRHFHVDAARLEHPGGVLGFRVSVLGRSIVYATDTEHPGGEDVDPALLALATGADILIYDAQYTPEEYQGADGICRRGWGHSTWQEGVRLASAAEVSKLILFHHDPARDDAGVAAIEEAAREQFPLSTAAREGMEIALHSRVHCRAA